MAKVSVSVRVAANADRVWELIGDFSGLADWASGVDGCASNGRDVGAVRTVATSDGRRRRERLESFDEVGRSYSYALIDGAPVNRHIATLKVWAGKDGSAEVDWAAEFEADGTAEGEIAAAMEAFFRDSLENVRERFA